MNCFTEPETPAAARARPPLHHRPPGHLVVLDVGTSSAFPSRHQATQAFASSRIGSRSGVVRYDKISGCSSASFNRYEDMFDEDDVARLPFRLGLGRVMDATGYLQDS